MRPIFRFAVAAFAVAFVSLWYASSSPARDWRAHVAHDGPGKGKQPPVYVVPEIDLDLKRAQDAPQDPEAVPAELARCEAAGGVLIVDCLMNKYSSVAIRRLEACLGTETLPVDERAVRACLAEGHW